MASINAATQPWAPTQAILKTGTRQTELSVEKLKKGIGGMPKQTRYEPCWKTEPFTLPEQMPQVRAQTWPSSNKGAL